MTAETRKAVLKGIIEIALIVGIGCYVALNHLDVIVLMMRKVLGY